MTRDEAFQFALRWSDAWNRQDLEAILEHFTDDVVFSSPKALDAVGVPSVNSKGALRDYWKTALSRVTQLHFTVVRIVWDPALKELAIVYDRQVNNRQDRASENLRFNDAGLVARGEVFYGVVP
jgi:hypothetical protein